MAALSADAVSMTARGDARRRARILEAALAIAVGVVAGSAGVEAAGLPLRWLVYVSGALAVATIILAVGDRRRFLSALFFFSLQIGAAYRVGFGRAGSTGLAFPFAAVAAAVYLVWLIASGETRRWSRIDWGGGLQWPLLAVIGMSALSLLFTSEKFIGLAQLLYELQLYLIFWLALNAIRSTAELDRSVRLLLVALFCQPLVYFVQSTLGLTFTGEGTVIDLTVAVPRPGGTVATNPAGFASFVIPLLCIAVARLTILRGRQRVYMALLVVLGMAAIGLTFTRAAWGGLGLALAVLYGIGTYRGVIRVRWIVPTAALAVAIFIALAPGMAQRSSSEYGFANAVETRWGLMRIAFNVIAHHPLVGVGPGAYGDVFKAYVPGDLSGQWLYTVHNEFLLRAAETGIIGGLAFAAMVVMGLRQAFRLTASPNPIVRTTAIGWTAGLVYLIWQMSVVPWRGFEYNALTWLLLGLTAASARLSGLGGYGSCLTEMNSGAGGGAGALANSRAPRSGALPLHGT